MIPLIRTFILETLGLGGNYSIALSYLAFAALVFIICLLASFFTKRYLVSFAKKVLVKARPQLEKPLNRERTTTKLSRIAPAVILYAILQMESDAFSEDFPQLFSIVLNLNILYLLAMLLLASNSILDAFERYYNTFEVAKKMPIKSYLQIFKVCLVMIVAILYFFKEPGTVVASMAAYSALLLVLFRDSINGFLASIQLSSYDMIRIGDWIEVPKFDASGDVEEISLTTVKVRNFDKTITTIPSNSLVNEGVKNWRGMKESGGRRIKRSLRLDLGSVKFCTAEIYASAKELGYIEEIISTEQQKLTANPKYLGLSNVQLFRAYIKAYLSKRVDTYNEGFTFMVRELEADVNGLPIELYLFTKTTIWLEYEAIQADIFDHAFAVLPYFDLKPFQIITGNVSSK